VVAPTMLAHHFLKTLEENAPAYILNVSSLASFFPLPKKVVYGSTKSYLVSFSRSLNMEMKEKNVFVSTVCPGGMNTTPLLILQNKNQKGVARWSIMNPEEVAKVAIDGMFKKKKVIIPGFWNKLVILLDKLLPKWIKEMITKMAMKRAQPFYNPRIIPINPLKKAI
jgi:short-subunit dehydrogenase